MWYSKPKNIKAKIRLKFSKCFLLVRITRRKVIRTPFLAQDEDLGAKIFCRFPCPNHKKKSDSDPLLAEDEDLGAKIF